MNADEAMRNRRRVAAGMPPLIFKPGAGGGHWGAVVARTSHGARQTANPRAVHGLQHGVAPHVPTVLAPLPVPAHVPNPLTFAQQQVDDRTWTGTVKSMTPRTLTNPRASAQKSEGTHNRGLEGIDAEILLFRMQTWPVVRTKRAPGVTSSRAGFEAWLADPMTGEEIHVYIKPTYGQSPGIRSAYMLGKDETEREYAGYRINELLGRPLDHQVTIIRDFGTYVNPDSLKVVGHSIVNLWTDPAPGYGTVQRPSTAFRDFPAHERSAAAMYDALVFNTDRHVGNYYEMKDPQGTSHIIAIDPSLAYPHFRNGQGTGHGSTDWTSRSQPLTPDLLERLAGILIDEVSIRAEFEPMLGRNVVDGLFKRARWMYQHGRTLSTLDLDQQVWWNS